MKFAKADTHYLSQRKQLSERYGSRELWSIIDQWPLYCGIGNLARFLAIYELFKQTLDVPGHIAEFGTWRGANLMFLAKLLRIYDPHGCKVVHCFDSFKGLTEFSKADAEAENFQGQYQGSYEELMSIIELYEMTDEVIVHKGVIEETLTPLLDKQQALRFSFVYCDTDLYASTALILDALHPRLTPGGVFVLDEWNYDNLPGESIAVAEFMERHASNYTMEHVRQTRQPSLVLRKTAY